MLKYLANVTNAFPQLSETFLAEEISEVLPREVSIETFSQMQPIEQKSHMLIFEANLLERISDDSDRFACATLELEPVSIHGDYSQIK